MRTRPTRRLVHQRGFGLIDALVATGLLSVFMLAAHGLLVPAMGADRHANSVTAATRLAQMKIEEFRAAAYSTLASGTDSQPLTASGTTGTSQAIYQRSWTVGTGPATDTKEVAVTVQWTDGVARHASLTTIVAK